MKAYTLKTQTKYWDFSLFLLYKQFMFIKEKLDNRKNQKEGKIMYGTIYQFILLATDIVLGAEKNTQMSRIWAVNYRRETLLNTCILNIQ